MRIGYHKLHSSLPEGKYVILGDVTIDIGKIKCLITVATDLAKLEERRNYTLSLNDLQIATVNTTEKSNGEFAMGAFQEAFKRVGGVESVAALIIDGGPDIQRGTRLLNEANIKVKVIADLSHKLAIVLENELTADPNWDEYTKEFTICRKHMCQTEFAALMPPKLRSKARFMNAALYIDWPDRIKKNKQAGNLDKIPLERFQQYFGWLNRFYCSLDSWIPKVSIIEMIKDITRIHGLSKDSYEYLKSTIEQIPMEKDVEALSHKALQALYHEVEKLEEGQVLPAFTESVESMIGAHKNHISRGGQGICGNTITMPTLIGPSLTVDEIYKAMEMTPVRTMLSWIKKNLGDTVGSLRRKFFKRTKFDEIVFT
jgi:hypothetical protein